MTQSTIGFVGKRGRTAPLRTLALVCLTCALLAPKLSFAFSTLFGEGYRSVVVCRGTELVRVTVGPDGEIVDDLTENWVAPSCVLTQDDVAHFERAWRRVGYPERDTVSIAPVPPSIPLPRLLGPALAARGPPTR